MSLITAGFPIFMTCPHDKLWRAMRLSFLGQLIAGCNLMTHVFEEKVGEVSTDNVRVSEAAR